MLGAFAEPDPQKQEDKIRMYTYTIFLIGVAGAFTQFISSAALTKAGEELTMRMRALSFTSMLRQEIGWFDLDENNLGALVTRLSSDAASLKGFTGPTFGAILNAVGALVSGLVISFTAGWKLTLIILCFSPLMVLTGIVQEQQVSKAAATGKKKAGTSDAEEGGKVTFLLKLKCFYFDLSSACYTSDRKYSNCSVLASRRTFHQCVSESIRSRFQMANDNASFCCCCQCARQFTDVFQ